MFVSKMALMQFIDSKNGQRSAPFVLDPNKFPERVGGFDDEMLDDSLVLVIADCSIDDTGQYVMSAVSRFPIVSARTFKLLAEDNVSHRAFSDDTVLRVLGVS